MKKIFVLLLTFSIIIGCSTTEPLITSNDVTVEELQKHIKFLASDELQGRRAGTKGNELAARYIADQFKYYGLFAAGDNGTYYHNFKFVSELQPGENNVLAIKVGEKNLQFTSDIDFRPMAYSSDTTVSGELAFVGYGISADTLNYDDYENIDIKGKVVIILRYTPEGKMPHGGFADHASFQKKIMTAREKGAQGIIFITGPADEDSSYLLPLRQERGVSNSGLAVIQITQEKAKEIFSIAGMDLLSIQNKINTNKKSNSFTFENVSISLQAEIEKIYANTSNVVGYLEGNDPVLKDQCIIIGAHFDHIGMGGYGSGSLTPDTIAAHNGADDNASGVAALLELAQYFSVNRNQLKRSLFFASFSAEELGLLGSSHFIKSPPFSLEKTTAMLNMDMIGRLKDSALTIQGVGTSPIWDEIIQRQNTDSIFKLKLGQDGFGSSDHASFNSKEIPVLFFFTGLHSDYHKPSDDWDLINYEGQKLVVDFIRGIIEKMDTISEKPLYTKVERPASMREGMQRGFRVTLGILPDFGDDAQGLRISGTRPGTPAEKAGLEGGDIIIQFGGKDVKNIYDLTFLLGDHKPGDEVDIVVIRGEEQLTLHAILESR